MVATAISSRDAPWLYLEGGSLIKLLNTKGSWTQTRRQWNGWREEPTDLSRTCTDPSIAEARSISSVYQNLVHSSTPIVKWSWKPKYASRRVPDTPQLMTLFDDMARYTRQLQNEIFWVCEFKLPATLVLYYETKVTVSTFCMKSLDWSGDSILATSSCIMQCLRLLQLTLQPTRHSTTVRSWVRVVRQKI